MSQNLQSCDIRNNDPDDYGIRMTILGYSNDERVLLPLILSLITRYWSLYPRNGTCSGYYHNVIVQINHRLLSRGYRFVGMSDSF